MRNRLKRAFWRPWGVVAAVLFIIGAATFFYALREFGRLQDVFATTPMTLAADLSRAGRVTAPFHQLTSATHGEVVNVTFDPTLESSESLLGLEARLVIAAPDGTTVREIPADADALDAYLSLGGSTSGLFRFSPPAVGDYTATLDVTAPAPAMAGHRVVFTAAYEPCGLEFLACHMLALAGLALAGIALFVAAILLVVTRPKRAAGGPDIP